MDRDRLDVVVGAALVHADLMRLGETVAAAEAAGCGEVFVHIADGRMAPRLALTPEFVAAVTGATKLPCTAYLLMRDPERWIAPCIGAGAHTVVLQREGCTHVQRALTSIREAGAKSGIAVNPGTSLTKLDYLLSDVDRVHVLTSEWGFEKSVFLGSSVERVRILRENLGSRSPRAAISVDGPLTPYEAAKLTAEGADIVVLGREILPQPEEVGSALERYRKELRAKRLAM